MTNNTPNPAEFLAGDAVWLRECARNIESTRMAEIAERIEAHVAKPETIIGIASAVGLHYLTVNHRLVGDGFETYAEAQTMADALRTALTHVPGEDA